MATVTLQRIRGFTGAGGHAEGATGPITGKRYSIDQLGRVTVDVQDAPYFTAKGWAYWQPGSGGGTSPTSGTALIDFGAFPGSDWAQTLVPAVDAGDPNAIVDAWILPAATADHSIDEHIADAPQVSGYADGNGNVVITGVPRPGLTSPIPPDPMPYGKWNVAWAFSP
jgi:hypothetical protein